MRHRNLLWLLSVVVGLGVAACSDSAPSKTLVATDGASAAGIASVARTHGDNCIADIDGDGLLDLILNNHAAAWPLLRGRPDGRFERLDTLELEARDRHACSVADFDGNGLLDVYLAIGACKGTCEAPKELWMQQPDGRFVDEAADWGIADPGARGRVSLALDANGDGRPDLFTGAEETVDFPSLSRLWINQGDRFELQEGPLVNDLGNLCAAAADIDGDGLDELAICTPRDGFRLYRNEGSAYVEATAELGLETFGRRAAEFVDLDDDGRPDLVTVTKTTVQAFLNDGDGYSKAAFNVKASDATDVAFGDVDGDGDLDLYVQEGGGTTEPDRIYLNDGDGRSFTRGPSVPVSSSGAGDAVQTIPDWRDSGRDAFLVNNGALDAPGPRQLITVSES